MRTFAELNEAWNTVEGKPDIYTIHLTEEEVEQSESWITHSKNCTMRQQKYMLNT